ncbi:hypothetical protein TURU_103504 [Turdus rufiventris]|nr:hypothetical protein TURU_103504 [Turdus rufiventris]
MPCPALPCPALPRGADVAGRSPGAPGAEGKAVAEITPVAQAFLLPKNYMEQIPLNPTIMWTQIMGTNKPILKCNIFCKREEITGPGMLDTGADVTIIARSEWPANWPLQPVAGMISGIGGVSVSMQGKHNAIIEGPEGSWQPSACLCIPLHPQDAPRFAFPLLTERLPLKGTTDFSPLKDLKIPPPYANDGSGSSHKSVMIWKDLKTQKWESDDQIVDVSAQIAELAAVVRAFEKFKDKPFNMVIDSACVAGIAMRTEHTFIKEASNPTLHQLISELTQLISTRKQPYHVMHGSMAKDKRCGVVQGIKGKQERRWSRGQGPMSRGEGGAEVGLGKSIGPGMQLHYDTLPDYTEIAQKELLEKTMG